METVAKGPGNGSDIERLGRMVREIPIAMLTTRHDETDQLRSRPMLLPRTDFDGAFWLFARRDCSAVEDILADARVNLAFADPASKLFVSATGMAEISHDHDLMKQLWSPAFGAWFPLGAGDPELCLLRVHVESADYWEAPHAAEKSLAGFARSVLQGRRDRGGSEVRGHLELGPPWH